MKRIEKYTMVVMVCSLLVMLVSSCKKEGYLTDGGVAKAVTPLSNYDYLKANKFHYFDTTILLIDHFNLKDSVNKAGTFFAFTNFSVNALMTRLQCNSLDQLYDSVSSKLLTQYMFSDTSITLSNMTLDAKLYRNWASDTLKSGVKVIEGTYVEYLTSSIPVFTYNTLQYVKVNGVIDNSAGAPVDDPIDIILSCQTTGIKTSSGAKTLHVFANNVTLNKY